MLIMSLAYVLVTTPAGWFRAWVAQKMGDDTPAQMGFLSLNPLDHFDPVGFSFLILSRHIFGFIIGWGKHVPINRDNFYGPYALVKYAVAALSDVFMHLLMATFAMVMLVFLFDLTIVAQSPHCIALAHVLNVFLYLNIFFAVISILSTVIMNLMSYLLQRYDVEQYFYVVLLVVFLFAMLLGGVLKPLFWRFTTTVGSKCATLVTYKKSGK